MNITYLFGAGASSKTLPVSSLLGSEIMELGHRIRDFPFKTPRLNELKVEFANDCSWLVQVLEGTSLDARAKQYILNTSPAGQANLQRLKHVVSICFSYWQRTRLVDPRYENFMSKIFTTGFEISSNTTILSWNYDSQFEIAFSQFQLRNPWQFYWQSRKELKMYSKHERDPGSLIEARILQLNGSAAEVDPDSPKSLFATDYDVSTEEGLLTVYDGIRNTKSCLSFVYEPQNAELIGRANQVLKDTDVLIVVGYSFPSTNLEIDRHLVNNFLNIGKIFIHDISPYDVKDKIEKILGDSFHAAETIESIRCESVTKDTEFTIYTGPTN